MRRIKPARDQAGHRRAADERVWHAEFLRDGTRYDFAIPDDDVRGGMTRLGVLLVHLVQVWKVMLCQDLVVTLLREIEQIGVSHEFLLAGNGSQGRERKPCFDGALCVIGITRERYAMPSSCQF